MQFLTTTYLLELTSTVLKKNNNKMCFPVFSNIAAGFPSPITSYGPLLLQFSLFFSVSYKKHKYYLTKLHYEVIMLLHHFEELNL